MRLLLLKAFCLLGAATSLLLTVPVTSARGQQAPNARPVDIAVVISPQLGTIRVGSFLTLRIHVPNFGPNRSWGLSSLDKVEDFILVLPQKVVLVDFTGEAIRSPFLLGTQFVTAFLPAIEPGASTTVRVTVEPLAPGLLIFETFVSAGLSETFDTNPSNNHFTQYIWVEP